MIARNFAYFRTIYTESLFLCQSKNFKRILFWTIFVFGIIFGHPTQDVNNQPITVGAGSKFQTQIWKLFLDERALQK